MLQAGLKKELDKFDRERTLVAWDGLISKQQTALAHHGVPAMFETNERPDREVYLAVMIWDSWEVDQLSRPSDSNE